MSNSSRNDAPAHMIVIEGIGSGERLLKILAERKPETKDIFVIEPSNEKFQAISQTYNLRPYQEDSSIHWMTGLTPERCFFNIFSLLKEVERSERISSRIYLRDPQSSAEYVRYFNSIEQQWESHIVTALTLFGSTEDAIQGLSNTFSNISFIQNNPGVDMIENLYQGRAAVVISTGPSLLESIEDIRAIQDRCILISVDASLKILLDHQITPHFVVTQERLETEPFFQNLKFPTSARPHLVAFPLSPKQTLDSFEGPKWVAYRNYDYYGFFSAQCRKGWLMTNHSVSHMAFGLAAHLGCSRVALVGQDLSYNPKTLASHPNGTSYAEWGAQKTEEEFRADLKKRNEEFYWVQGNVDERVPTSSVYVCYLQEFTDLFSKFPKVSVTNCTRGGARIGDIPRSELQKFAQSELAIEDVFSKLASLHGSYVRASSIDMFSVRQYLSQVKGYLDAGINVAHSPEALTRIHDLRHLQKELKNDRPFHAFVAHQMVRSASVLEDQWNQLPEKDPKVDAQKLEILSQWLSKSRDVLNQVERLLPS